MALEADPCLTADQHELRDLMGEVSERCWHAGWLVDTEYEVWRLVVEGGGWGHCDSVEIAELLAQVRALSLRLDTWIVWSDESQCDNQARDLMAWRRDYVRWRQAQRS